MDLLEKITMAYEKTMLNLIMCYRRIHRMLSAIGR